MFRSARAKVKGGNNSGKNNMIHKSKQEEEEEEEEENGNRLISLNADSKQHMFKLNFTILSFCHLVHSLTHPSKQNIT
ncbi:Hypothetical predicted protein [Octopus vulgaris]|uniref:Uncharacterized protein n=1 Tax=Octopus vulgaris TaxID=6645 RepID=A0AA36AWM7_OCTVU|nr:Hypothetical predicted protein [Octopus vulgaris]